MPFVLIAEDPSLNPMDASHGNVAAALWALCIFVVLFIVLWKKAWGPIVQGLQTREEKINASLERAEQLEKATRELAETNRQVMAKAQQEAQAVVAEARVAAKKAMEEISAKAHAEIDASRERFEREMRLEADKIRDDLRRETIDMVLSATAKMLGRTLNPTDHRRLAEESLRDAESVALSDSIARNDKLARN